MNGGKEVKVFTAGLSRRPKPVSNSLETTVLL